MLSTREESPLFEPMGTDSLNPIKAESNDNHDAKRQKVNEPSVLNSYSGGPLNVYIPGEGPYMYEECESVPRSPAYHPNVEQCRLLNKQAMEELLNHIMDGEQQDFEIQRLSQEFSDKRHIQMTNKMVMALDGDTGSGKSTTINSILGKTVLATKGCGGASCTQVVAEYADNPDTQGYEAHVHILPHEVIHDRVKAHVKKFRAHHQRSQSDDEPFSPVDDLAGEADTALEYFRTLFCDRPDCRTDQEIKNLLLSPSSTDAVTRFMQWIVQIKHSLNVEPHDTKFTFRASGLSELVAKTSRCTEKMNLAERTSSLWPIVGKVRFFLNSPFLRQGLELVDLPGLSDANEDRRNSSLTYLREFCSGIIVVAKADRPETHPSVIASVKRAIRLKGPSNVILVLTRTDDCPENPTDLSLQESEHLKILQYAFDASKTTFAEAKQNRVPRHELRRLREDKKFADVALQKARVLIRNQHLVHKLQSAYREFTRGSQLCVVPVSNANHQEHLHGFDEEDPPCLGVEDDGIRNLRHELLRILGHRTIETLERHRVTVNSLLTGLDLWLQRSRNDRKDMAIGMVKTHLEKCNNPLPQHERNLIVSFRDKFHASVGRQLGNVWQDKIVSLVEGWGKQYPANSFKAFCRRNGVHQPKGHAVFSMNEAVLAIAEKDLDRFERQMHDDIIKHSDDLTVYINGVFVLIEKGFESEHNTAGIDMTALIKRLDQRKWALGQNLREITATLKAELHALMFRAQSEAAMENDRYPDFMQEMKNIYAYLNQMKVKKVHAARVAQMHDRITSRAGPFLKLGNHVRRDFKAAVEKKWVVDIEESLRASLEEVLADIDVRFIGPEMPEEDRNELREGLKSILPGIYDIYEQRMSRLIEGCKEWARPGVPEQQASQPWEYEAGTGGL